MKTRTSDFKEEITLPGRELNDIITYEQNGSIVQLGSEEINKITPSFQGNILKSVMKELYIDSSIYIPKGTIINYKFGLKIDEEYEYLNFGNYVVESIEKNEDTFSYDIQCYDKMLYSMKANESLNINYPITIRNYIKALCTKIGLMFANENDNFRNYDKIISEELYLGLNYTYRNIFDELAQVTASTICLNQKDEVEIRYIKNTKDIINKEFFKDTNVKFGEKYGPVNSIVLSRSAESDNVYIQDIKNKFNKNDFEYINANIVNNQIVASDTIKTIIFPCEPLTDYTIYKPNSGVFSLFTTSEYPTIGMTIKQPIEGNTNEYLHIKTNSDVNYLLVTYYDINIPSGKNLFKPALGKITSRGVDITIEEDGIVTLNGTNTSTGVTSISEILSTVVPSNKLRIQLEQSKYYTLSRTVISGSVSSNSFALAGADTLDSLYPANYIFNFGILNTVKQTIQAGISTPIAGGSISLNSRGFNLAFNAVGIIFNNYKIRIQLEQNSISTEFEPFRPYNEQDILNGIMIEKTINLVDDAEMLKVLTTVGIKNYDLQPKQVRITNIENAQTWSYLRFNKINYPNGTYVFSCRPNKNSAINNDTVRPYGVFEIQRYDKGTFNNVYKYGSNMTALQTYTQTVPIDNNLYDYYINFYPTGGVILPNERTFIYDFNLYCPPICTLYLAGVQKDVRTTAAVRTLMIPCKPNQKYTVFRGNNISGVRFQMFSTIEPAIVGTIVTNTTGDGTRTDNILSYTTGENDKYLYIYFYITSSDTTDYQIALNELIVVEGDFPSEYNPYKINEIKIIDNQIMNWNNRADYLQDIFDELSGLEYYTNDFISTGIGYYDLCDGYYAEIDDNIYYCVMFNDEFIRESGLSENIYTDIPKETVTEYDKSSKDDRELNRVYLIVNKQNYIIEGLVSQTQNNETDIAQLKLESSNLNLNFQNVTNDVDNLGKEVATNTVTINNVNQKIADMNFNFSTLGLRIATSNDENNSLLDNTGIMVYNYDELRAIFNNNGVGIHKVIITGYLQVGHIKIQLEKINGINYTNGYLLDKFIENISDLKKVVK